VRFSPDGEWVLTKSLWDLRIWNKATGAHLYTLHALTPHKPGDFNSVAFSPDGSSLFAAGNGAVAMWELVPVPEFTIAKETDGRIALGGDVDQEVAGH